MNRHSPTRRAVLAASAAGLGLAATPTLTGAATWTAPPRQKEKDMGFITANDGAKIFYKDWGTGQPIVFSHGWPLSADAWDPQMQFFGKEGYRVVAHDRRSHGRSDQTWNGNHMDQYADDLAALINELDLRDIILVGHSTGGGEITHYVGRHGSRRVAKMVLIGAVPPLMLKTDANPIGLPIEVFDGIRKGTYENRSQFFKDLASPFYGYNRAGATLSEGVRDSFWLQGMMGGIKGQLDCIHEFSEVDYTPDLRKIDRPLLILHGDDDQIVPIDAAGRSTARIVRGSVLKIYEGGSHGIPTTEPDRVNADILAFLRG